MAINYDISRDKYFVSKVEDCCYNLKHNTGENNVVKDSHVEAAKAKGYKVYFYNGSEWVEK